MRNIFIIRLGRLGDVTLTGPTIKNLRFLYPDSKISYITREPYQSLCHSLFGVDEVLTFPNEGSYLDLVKLSIKLDDFQPDLVVDLHKNFRSFHLANLCKARYKVVYKKRRKERQAAVNEKIFVSPIPHTIDQYNLVIDKLKGERIARRPDIFIPYDKLSDCNFRREGVAIAPGAGSSVKCWPIENFVSVIEKLIGDFNFPISLFLSSSDDAIADKISHFPADRVSIFWDEPLDRIGEILSQYRLSLTNDSGLMHISSAAGTPTLGLFGPTHEQLGFYPLGVHDVMLGTDEKCRPCSLHGNVPCYREKQYCFTRMTVDFVYKQMIRILDKENLCPAVFIDRDGTLIVDEHYLANPDKIKFIDGSINALHRLKKAGFKIVIVSNQSGVARGFFPEEAVVKVHNRLEALLKENGIEIDDIRFCPYHPDGDVPEYTKEDECRKPRPGMLEKSAMELGIDLKRSYMIGDKLSDVQCGQAAGAIPVLVRTGYGMETEKDYPAAPYPPPYFLCDNLSAAADRILSKS
ncbi:MAG: D-glycero-beta-D-manno-heptose 1,7-bisphosphate 7-phosphatase [Candidatus Zixiibacteriota bacterium]